jgi:thiopeptide-type bacteriocin biosynthesis protein
MGRDISDRSSDALTIRHEGFFVLRSPLLPVSALDAALDAGDTATIDEILRSFVNDPIFLEALSLSSATLHTAAIAWRENRLNPNRVDRFRRGMLRYVTRAASRSTPFGLWAGVSFGSVGPVQTLGIDERSCYRRKARLDAGALEKIAARIHDESANPPLRLNSSAYRRDNRYFFVYRRKHGTAPTKNELTSIVATEYVDVVRRAAENGTRLENIAAALQEYDGELPHDDIVDFIRELFVLQFLVSGIGVVQTGESPTEVIEAWCREDSVTSARAFLCAANRVRELNDAPLGVDASVYKTAVEPLELDLDTSRAIQVDLWKPGQITLTDAFLRRVAQAVETLFRLTPPTKDPLAAFRARFMERYAEAAVPLMHVLDEEIGIAVSESPNFDGYPEPLLAGFPKRGDDEAQTAITKRDAVLMEHMEEAWRNGETVWSLTAKDIERLTAEDAPRAPDSVSATIRLMSQQRPGDPTFEIRSAFGPPATRMLARFAHLDPILKQHISESAHNIGGDDVLMEIVHVPEERAGNVMFRPRLAPLELPYLALSSADPSQQVRLEDLLVTVDRNRVRLFSERHGVYVVPMINTAMVHWVKANLPLFRFFGALQQQRMAGWTWGALGRAKFLPRVVLHDCLISRATWRLKWSEFAHEDDSIEAFARYLRRCGVPERFTFIEMENNVELSQTNPTIMGELLTTLRAGRTIFVTESLAGAQAVVRGPEGNFTQDCIIPLRRPREEKRAPQGIPQRPDSAFVTGSRWTTAKIYSGPSEIERILREDLGVIVDALRDDLTNWHFVRYYDPEHHVRLRFESASPEKVRRLIDRLFAEVMDRRAVRVTYDLYRPESWRYGGPNGIRLAERLFTYDSDAVREALRTESDPATRWHSALLDIESWLGLFHYDIAQMARFAERGRGAFMQEFGIQSAGEMSASVPRSLVQEGERVLRDETILPETRSAFERRRNRAAAAVDELVALEATGELTRPVSDILWSLIHMSVNRIVRTRPREQEACLYHVLSRYCTARLAREARR